MTGMIVTSPSSRTGGAASTGKPIATCSDLDALLRQRFIDQMRMIAGADMHMNGSLDFVARNRDLFAVERKNLFFNSMRLLGRIRMSGCRIGFD